MQPVHTSSPVSAVGIDGHDRLLCWLCRIIHASIPLRAGACSVSHSIASTPHAAMLRHPSQAPARGKTPASVDPPSNRGRRKRKGGGRDWLRRVPRPALDVGNVMAYLCHDHSFVSSEGKNTLWRVLSFCSRLLKGEVMACSGHDISLPQQNERTPFGMIFRFAFGFVLC